MSMNEGPKWEPAEPAEPAPTGDGRMALGQILEVGRRILRRHWAVLLMISLLFVGPGALLSTATALDFTLKAQELFPDIVNGSIDTDLRLTDAELERLLGALLPFLGASLLAGVLSSIGALAFSKTVAEDYHARPAEIGAVLRAALKRTPSALVFMLVTGLLMIGLIVCGLVAMSVATLVLPANAGGVGGPGAFVALIVVVGLALALVYLTMRWAPAYTSMVEEGAGWRQALSRSWRLSSDNVLRIFAVSAIVAIITGLLSWVLGGVFDVFLSAIVGSTLGLDPMVTTTIALAAASTIVAPAMPVLMAVLFFDLRTRRDETQVPAAPPPPPGPYG